MIKSLTAQQQKTLVFLIIAVLGLLSSGGMVFDLSRKRAEIAKLRSDLNQKQQGVPSIPNPTPEEEAQWAAEERQLRDFLIFDEAVPQFFEELTRLATENRLERIDINTEEKTIDATPNKEASGQQQAIVDPKAKGVGVQRLLLVTLKFRGDYADSARFIAALSALPRPSELRTIEMRRDPPRVDVTVILHVYRREKGV